MEFTWVSKNHEMGNQRTCSGFTAEGQMDWTFCILIVMNQLLWVIGKYKIRPDSSLLLFQKLYSMYSDSVEGREAFLFSIFIQCFFINANVP